MVDKIIHGKLFVLARARWNECFVAEKKRLTPTGRKRKQKLYRIFLKENPINQAPKQPALLHLLFLRHNIFSYLYVYLEMMQLTK
jgi:hypothetical protein